MGGEMDDDILTGLYGINMEDVEEYVGKYSMANVSSDEILIVKAAKGKANPQQVNELLKEKLG